MVGIQGLLQFFPTAPNLFHATPEGQALSFALGFVPQIVVFAKYLFLFLVVSWGWERSC